MQHRELFEKLTDMPFVRLGYIARRHGLPNKHIPQNATSVVLAKLLIQYLENQNNLKSLIDELNSTPIEIICNNPNLIKSFRYVSQITPEKSEDNLTSFANYLPTSNIILLGNPGAGKTHTFKAAAEVENAKFYDIRSFLACEGMGLTNDIIYLDGLDEYRSRIGDHNAVSEIVKILNRIGKPKLRLSCRAADWLGESDLSLFQNAYFEKNNYVVLNLEALTDTEIVNISIQHGVINPEKFINEAQRRGLRKLLDNPQTLIMLINVVGQGVWPKTKRALYQLACEQLLIEHNDKKVGSSSGLELGQYTANELLEPAGAICAALLISNTEGISLKDNAFGELPSYREIPHFNPQLILSALTRRIFLTLDNQQEAVTYVHRTIAEYLAAYWLSQQVSKNQLPLSRIQALLGVELHPSSELRGLHAWLTTLLPSELASLLIPYDLYGILMYGDAASLSPNNRQNLLKALKRQADDDPWFRADNWSDEPLGALSSEEMVDGFRKILFDENVGFHLKTIVLGAIRNGTPLPQMQEDLYQVLINISYSYAEREDALEALLKIEPTGTTKVYEAFQNMKPDAEDTIRLRQQIIKELNDTHFHVKDIVSVFIEGIEFKGRTYVGGLLSIANRLPEKILPELLNSFSKLANKNFFDKKNTGELDTCISLWLEKLINSKFEFDDKTLLLWLKGLYLIRGIGGNWRSSRNEAVRQWLLENSDRVSQMFSIAYEQLDDENFNWSFLHSFQASVLYSINDIDIARQALQILLQKQKSLTNKDIFLYEIFGTCLFRSDVIDTSLFENFQKFTDSHLEVKEVYERTCQCGLDDWRYEDALLKKQIEKDKIERRTKNIAILETTKSEIQSGKDLENLSFLAQIYWGFSVDSNNDLSPIERLKNEIGDELTSVALEGFAKSLFHEDLPAPVQVASLSAEQKYKTWWYAVIIGANIWCHIKKGMLDFPDKILKSVLAIKLEHQIGNTSDIDCDWEEQLYSKHPELVESVYYELASTQLKLNKEHISVLHSLAHDEKTLPWSGKLALRLLHEFPSLPHNNLHDIVLAAFFHSENHTELLNLTHVQFQKNSFPSEKEKTIWLCIGFLLDFSFFHTNLREYTQSDKDRLWIVISMFRYDYPTNRDKPIKLSNLSVEHIAFLIQVIGQKFNHVNSPRTSWGNSNPSDATEFVCNTINILSTKLSLEATKALQDLLQNKNLISYHENIKHALANQLSQRRQANYQQPTWQETIAALQHGTPANMISML